MTRRSLLLSAALAIGAFAGVAQAQSKHFYRLESATTIPGASPSWDYLAKDPARPYLFIGRRAGGMMVYDTDAQKVVQFIENSKNAGAIVLLPEFDRGYTANEDGATTIFQLSTLKTLDRVKFGEDADGVFYEPVTRQLVFTQGDSKALVFMDAETGKIVGKVAAKSQKLDGTVGDGAGFVFTAERDRNVLLRVDAKTRKVLAEWKTECDEPTGLAADSANHRLFIGCRGKNPVLVVMNAETGKIVAKLEIGRENDGVVFDPETRKIYTSNGIDGNIVIFDQKDADNYALDQAFTTRPIARTMALDTKTKAIYTVTAEGTVDPAKKVNRAVGPFYPNVYFDDTFTILKYVPK